MLPKSIAVDVGCSIPNGTVYSDAKCSYSCSLTYTDIGNNSNKFYIMQIVFSPPNRYGFYTKYGRTGEKGTAHTKEMDNANSAVKAFQSQYKSKTGNVWGSTFVAKPNKYFLLEVENFEEEVSQISSEEESNDLETKVIDLIKLISNTDIHTKAMRSFGVDTKKMPLGKISASIIDDADGILFALSEIVGSIEDGTWGESKKALDITDDYIRNVIYSLSNKFWTRIPYACGREKPPVIDNPYRIDQCAELIDIMRNTKIATQIIRKNVGIFDIYKGIDANISMCSEETEIDFVTNFVLGTKAPTHNYKLEVLEVYCVHKATEDRNDIFYKTSNHMLLAHGSRMSNFVGILSTGLRIPNNTQITNGSILGRGIYFADVISKSFNYCNAHDTDDVGFVLLCEVALGDSYDDHETVVPYNRLDLPKKCTSRRGMGKTDVTNILGVECEGNGMSYTMNVPQGGLKERKGLSNNASFLYNEYVIFNALQYRFRYLVKIKSY